MKLFLFLALMVSLVFSQNIKSPISNFKLSGSLVDMVYKDDKLYCATDASSVDIFDFKSKKLIKKIELGKITDFMGDKIDSKVYSVDLADDKILILSQDEKGFRRVHIHQNNKTELLFGYKESITASKAKFLDKDTILLGLLSNELVSYDIKSKKKNWLKQVSGAKFSDFALNEQKSEVVVADESGNLKIHATKDGKFLKILADKNLDNVFEVDYKNGFIATAGQDRKVVLYNTKAGTSSSVQSSFLVYSVGLSPKATYVGYSSDEQNNVTVVDVSTKSVVGKFGGNSMTITKILFINENEFLVGSDSDIVNLYSVK